MLFFLGLLLFTSWCCKAPEPAEVVPGATAQSYDGSGRVLSMSPRSVHLLHGPIPDLMGAMEMTFLLSKAVESAGVAVGDSVRFRLAETSDGGLEVVRMEQVRQE
jgi:Cu/Ag efflux protein CusF